MRRIYIVLFGFMLLAGCATTGGDNAEMAGKAKPGFLEGYYEKLAPGEKEGAKLRWLKPGVDFKTYDKRIREEVTFLMNNLCTKCRYTSQGAKEVCIYVIDNDLARKYTAP